jgi:class 3 adenylate cyclase
MAHRISIVTATSLSIGSLVAATVAVALYFGLSGAIDNTRRLLEEQVDDFIDYVEQRIQGRLQPVVSQASWIVERVSSGLLDLDNTEQLDAFMLGALAATPQVGGIAIVRPDGRVRRWAREDQETIVEDWSTRPEIMEWLRVGATETDSEWREPFWTSTIDAYVVLHDSPLRRGGEFLGMLAQIVPISDLSTELVRLTEGTELVPFALYDEHRVLAHPALVASTSAKVNDSPLKRLDEIGDAVLQRIWSPDYANLFLLANLTRTSASAVEIDGRQYAFLYRNIEDYGPRPWTIGVYFDVDAEEHSVVDRLVFSLAAGLAVLGLSIVVAVLLGRWLSRPVQAIAAVASTVSEERLGDTIRLPASPVREIDEANRSINAMVEGLRERQMIRETLGRYLPEQVARTILSSGGKLDVESAEATVLFCDIEGFTHLTEALGPERVVELLNAYFSAMVEILERHDGVVTQFQGDAILAVFNVPVRNPHHARNAINAAKEMQYAVRERTFAGCKLATRIGINTGPVVAGAVGAEGRLSYTVHGDAVNLAARLESLNREYQTRVLVSGATAALAGDSSLSPLGPAEVRGQSEPVDLYALSEE